MSMQDRLARASARAQRRLYDNLVKLTGRDVEVFRFSYTQKDIYDQELRAPIGEPPRMTVKIKYPPGGVPLARFRYQTGAITAEVQQTGLFLFDVLPIEVFSKFTDHVEKGDILFHLIEDESDNRTGILLQISETLGSFTTSIVMKRHLAAPFNELIPADMQAIIDKILREGLPVTPVT